jgi:hypothetical protein
MCLMLLFVLSALKVATTRLAAPSSCNPATSRRIIWDRRLNWGLDSYLCSKRPCPCICSNNADDYYEGTVKFLIVVTRLATNEQQVQRNKNLTLVRDPALECDKWVHPSACPLQVVITLWQWKLHCNIFQMKFESWMPHPLQPFINWR